MRKPLCAFLMLIAMLLVSRSPVFADVVQHAEGGIDYVHEHGDFVPGNFYGIYRVEFSNEGIFEIGERNNGLFIEEWCGVWLSCPRLDCDLTLFNCHPAVSFLASGTSLPPPTFGANPLVFYACLDFPCGIQLDYGKPHCDGRSGNVHVKFDRVCDFSSSGSSIFSLLLPGLPFSSH